MYEKLCGEDKAFALLYTLKMGNHGPVDQDNSQAPLYETQWSFVIRLCHLNHL